MPEEINGQLAEPDLIRVYATNGHLGYVHNQERKVATGDPSLFKSPEEALRWQANRAPGPVSIPVYDLDGVTKIGEFEFSAPNPTGTIK
ncbi:DNA-directed RNA polymerase specialized sigma subunit, sigma24 [Arthrobacter sp. MWB30]|nr:DNA-directed RNA polymerase specialized sigma subunit, sigma24 [Arthrobacter sp. MWB30]